MIESKSKRFGYYNGFACVDGVKEEYDLICDICGKTIKFDTFNEAVQFKKDNNWRSKKQLSNWIDMCDKCKN